MNTSVRRTPPRTDDRPMAEQYRIECWKRRQASHRRCRWEMKHGRQTQ